MADVIRPMRLSIRQQSGIARLPVLVVSLVVTASLALVALDRLFLPERFTIREVLVKGDAPNVNPAWVVSRVRELGPRSWFSVDLAEVEAAVRAVPWVFTADVRRKWPGKLVIHVTQASPFALWNDSSWIGESGQPVPLPNDFAGAHLPRLSGPPHHLVDVLERYRELRELFARVGFDVLSITLDARGAWRMTMTVADDSKDRSIMVSLGREQALERAIRLAAVLGGPLRDGIDEIRAFDLRYPNGFAVAMADPVHGEDGFSMAPQPMTSLAGHETKVP